MHAIRLTLASISMLAVLIPTGCSTGSDRAVARPQAQIYAYREPSTRDGLFPMVFAINGKPVASLQPRQGYRFELAPGDYTFAYEMGVYNCSEPVKIPTAGSYRFRLAHGCVIEPEPR